MPTGVFGLCKGGPGKPILRKMMMNRMTSKRGAYRRGRKVFYGSAAPVNGTDNPSAAGDLFHDVVADQIYAAVAYTADGTGTVWSQITV